MKTGQIILVFVLAAVAYWLYEANPGNIFQRGM